MNSHPLPFFSGGCRIDADLHRPESAPPDARLPVIVAASGYQGLNAFPVPGDGTARTVTAAAMFSMVAPAYAGKYGVPQADMKTALARVASKNHYNGARNPRAQFRSGWSGCRRPGWCGSSSPERGQLTPG